MRLILPFIVTLLLSLQLQAFTVPPNSGPVVDQAGIFNRQSLIALRRALMKFKLEHGPEIQILVLKSLDGEPIEDVSYQVMSKWKIGDKERDDGVLFTVALNDRKMRIEVGDGLEGVLTDLDSNRIIEQIKPYFRRAAYRDGVIAGANLIATKLGGPLTAAPEVQRRHRRKRGSSFFSLIILFIIFSLFSGRGGGGLIQGMILGSMLGGGGRSGGGGSDIFSGGFGGGGDFSGGGASGDW